MAKTNKHAPGLYQKAKQQEAEKLAGGSPRNKRLDTWAQRAAGDNEDGALSDDAISTDPRKTVINYGDDNIECDDGNFEGDNDEEAENEDEGYNDERRKMVTMIRAMMKMNRAMRMTVTMRMGMRMTMRVRVRMKIMMTLTMRTTKANFMMMMKVVMILSRGGSTMYHLPVAKELDERLSQIVPQGQTLMVSAKLRL
jgi:hypothetical protein